MDKELSGQEFTRLANNFYTVKGLVPDPTRIALDAELINYVSANHPQMKKKFKVAFCWICLNPPYWEYAKDMVSGAKQFFLPGHNVDFFLWSDIPKTDEEINDFVIQRKQVAPTVNEAEALAYIKDLSSFIHTNMTVFPTEGVEWPLPTLMRYSLFLQQEEKLKEYDYIFYCDVDMKFVNVVGDEILGKGLTAALHPGYATRKEYWPPYEPNKNSASYINRPGMVIDDGGKRRFMPMYFAGGFQGGVASRYLEAMKTMKHTIEKDFMIGYQSIWNDESHWNKYLEKTPEDTIVLTPSYIYPDSLIKEYYEPLWGCSYPPKLITLTKKFSVSKEGGEAVQKMINK